MTDRRLTNSDIVLKCKLSREKRTLQFDFPGLRVGSAEYDEGPTGCTVFRFDRYASCAVDIRGGSTCSVVLDGWDTGDAMVDAICFAGGSCCGLEAIAGAATSIFNERSDGWRFDRMARIMGAIIYDYRPRDNSIYPDRELGAYAAKHASAGVFPLGPCGAGSSASVGKGPAFNLWERSGQGGAFAKRSQFSVALFTVVNAVGAVVDRNGSVVRGHLDAESGRRRQFAELFPYGQHCTGLLERGSNTTHTCLITDLMLSSYQLRQLARSVHSSMARAIHPFHTINDGDAFFAVSTQRAQCGDFAYDELIACACDCAWDAVLSCFD